MAKPAGSVNVSLSTREAKAAASALEDAAKRAGRGTRFHTWADEIAKKIRSAMKPSPSSAPTASRIYRDVWLVFNSEGKAVQARLVDERGIQVVNISGLKDDGKFTQLQGEFRAYLKQPETPAGVS